MKKLLGGLTALAAASLCCLSAAAAGMPAFSVTDASGRPGDEVRVNVEISDNPGIIAYHLLVDYDSDALELTDASGGIFSGTASGPLESDPFSFLWADALHGDYTDNGTLIELTFKIKDNAADGEHPVTLSYKADDVFNYDMENVHFDTGPGKITVTGKAAAKPSDSSLSAETSAGSSGGESLAAESSSVSENTQTGGQGGTVTEASSSEPADEVSADTSESDAAVDSRTEAASDTSAAEEASQTSAAEAPSKAETAEQAAAESASSGDLSSSAEERSSGVPFAAVALLAAAAAGAVVIIIMRKKKQ